MNSRNQFFRKKALALAAMAMALGFGGSAAKADLLVNGGFETGDFTGWTVSGDATSVETAGYDGFTPHSGTYFAALGDTSSTFPYGTLSQTVADTAGQTLTLTYWLASDGALPNFINVTWDGVLVPGSTVTDSAAFPWTMYQFSVLAIGDDTLLFNEQNIPAYDALDDVSLASSSQSQSSVPEPASMLLFGAGLLGVSKLRRRKLG